MPSWGNADNNGEGSQNNNDMIDGGVHQLTSMVRPPATAV